MEKVKNVSVTGNEVELWDNISNCELSFGNFKKMETVLKSNIKKYLQPHFYTLIYMYFSLEQFLSIIQTPNKLFPHIHPEAHFLPRHLQLYTSSCRPIY